MAKTITKTKDIQVDIFLNVKHFAQLTSKIFRARKIVEQKSKADDLQEVTNLLTP